MPERFLLERAFTRAEFDWRYPVGFVMLGVLLRAAYRQPPPSPDLDAIASRLGSPGS